MEALASGSDALATSSSSCGAMSRPEHPKSPPDLVWPCCDVPSCNFSDAVASPSSALQGTSSTGIGGAPAGSAGGPLECWIGGEGWEGGVDSAAEAVYIRHNIKPKRIATRASDEIGGVAVTGGAGGEDVDRLMGRRRFCCSEPSGLGGGGGGRKENREMGGGDGAVCVGDLVARPGFDEVSAMVRMVRAMPLEL